MEQEKMTQKICDDIRLKTTTIHSTRRGIFLFWPCMMAKEKDAAFHDLVNLRAIAPPHLQRDDVLPGSVSTMASDSQIAGSRASGGLGRSLDDPVPMVCTLGLVSRAREVLASTKGQLPCVSRWSHLPPLPFPSPPLSLFSSPPQRRSIGDSSLLAGRSGQSEQNQEQQDALRVSGWVMVCGAGHPGGHLAIPSASSTGLPIPLSLHVPF